MCKKLEFRYIDVESCIDNNTKEEQLEDIAELENQGLLKEIALYDFEKSFDENIETGTKYLLLPLTSNGFGQIENKQFLERGVKVVSKLDGLFAHGDREIITVDYNTMFGVRLKRFINYRSEFFLCDERVLFESLIMKFKYFGFVKFYLSYQDIFKELGIKKDRAKSIIKRFKAINIVNSEVGTTMLNGKPRQITYYWLKPEVIIELLPEIYVDVVQEDDEYGIMHDIKKYLEDAIPKKKRKNFPEDLSKKMQ